MMVAQFDLCVDTIWSYYEHVFLNHLAYKFVIINKFLHRLVLLSILEIKQEKRHICDKSNIILQLE